MRLITLSMCLSVCPFVESPPITWCRTTWFPTMCETATVNGLPRLDGAGDYIEITRTENLRTRTESTKIGGISLVSVVRLIQPKWRIQLVGPRRIEAVGNTFWIGRQSRNFASNCSASSSRFNHAD